MRLARRYDALIIADDVYDFLQWPSDPSVAEENFNGETALLPRIVDIDRYIDGGPIDEWGNAFSNGSFSKLIGPGMRVGWAEGTEKFSYGLSQAYVVHIFLHISKNVLVWLTKEYLEDHRGLAVPPHNSHQ